MHENGVEDSDVLNRYRTTWSAVLELALMLLYGAIALLGYGAWGVASTHGQLSVTLFDIRVALLMSASFMILSGYALTVILLYALYNYRQSWTTRAALNAGLFLVHVAIFAFLVGSSNLGPADLPLILLGVASVVAAEATVDLIRSKSTRQKA